MTSQATEAATIPALTIWQPYAHLIVTPQAELTHGDIAKRVENRTVQRNYRGPLAIHAGLKFAQHEPADSVRYPEMAFGAIVGIADLVGCIPIGHPRKGRNRFPAQALEQWPWLADHVHCEGPYGWILDNVRRLKEPVKARGLPGLWPWEPPAPLAELDLQPVE